jgi:hypothetical protein
MGVAFELTGVRTPVVARLLELTGTDVLFGLGRSAGVTRHHGIKRTFRDEASGENDLPMGGRLDDLLDAWSMLAVDRQSSAGSPVWVTGDPALYPAASAAADYSAWAGTTSPNAAACRASADNPRAAKATRPVPIPPVLVRMLREHMERFGWHRTGACFATRPGTTSTPRRTASRGAGRARRRSLWTSTPWNRRGGRTTCAMPASPSGWLRGRPGRVRAQSRAEHRGSLPLLRQVPRRNPPSRQPPHRGLHAAVGRARGATTGALAGTWPGNAPEQLVRGGIRVGWIGSKAVFRLAVQAAPEKGTCRASALVRRPFPGV